MDKNDHTGPMAYPKKGTLNRIIYKLPLFLWRLGFGPVLSHSARGGKRMMVVTTRGRKSKLPRHTMVSNIIFNHKDYAVSGWWQQADWVKNFLADPLVTIQAGGRVYSAYARRVEDPEEIRSVAQALFDSGGDSHFKDWLAYLDIEHNLDDLIEKKELVNFVGFDLTEEEGPDQLSADLLWIWAVIISFLLGLIFFFW